MEIMYCDEAAQVARLGRGEGMIAANVVKSDDVQLELAVSHARPVAARSCLQSSCRRRCRASPDRTAVRDARQSASDAQSLPTLGPPLHHVRGRVAEAGALSSCRIRVR
jgi:hypothetical protein